jgi:hypothetical protein
VKVQFQSLLAILAITSSAVVSPAKAQSGCEASLDAELSSVTHDEAQLTNLAAAQVACLLDRAHPPLSEAIAVTKRYFELSKKPACQLLLLNAELHVQVAQQIESLVSPTPEQRDALGTHWRAAWEMAAGLSYAWSQHSTPNDEVFGACILPARQILKNFPSVTITVEPEDANDYELWWDGFRRTDSLPRILPNSHHELVVDPPPNHRVTVWVDQKCPKTANGRITVYPATQYHDPYGTHQIRIQFTDFESDPPRDTVCGQNQIAKPRDGGLGEGSAGATSEGSSYLAPLLWTGVGAAAVGTVGLIVSLNRASYYNDRAVKLPEQNGCVMEGTPECDAVFAEYDKRDAWNNWAIASGVVLGLGATAIVASFFLGDEPEKPKAETSMTLLPIVTAGKRTVGLGLLGAF